MNVICYLTKKPTIAVTLFATSAALGVGTAGSAAAQTVSRPLVLAKPSLVAGNEVTFPLTAKSTPAKTTAPAKVTAPAKATGLAKTTAPSKATAPSKRSCLSASAP